MSTVFFPHPEPARNPTRIHPVFLPFQGCPTRCVFCAQAAQTGTMPRPVLQVLAELDATLAIAAAKGEPARELAFYGGTFTAMPLEHQLACLELAARYRRRGLVSAVRCSTRPDCVTPSLLAQLKAEGLDMVELGIQSFSSPVLAASRRGHDENTAREACRIVASAGMRLGIQLMPGLPAGQDCMSTEQFLADMAVTVELAPETLRLYPCLVMEGTELAALWRQGLYTPWSLEQTIPALAQALVMAWAAGIRVIRMGVAPEQGLEEVILAGPQHPALGAMARAVALCKSIDQQREKADVEKLQHLHVPRKFQGEFWGHRNALIPEYAAMGLGPQNVTWWDEALFMMA